MKKKIFSFSTFVLLPILIAFYIFTHIKSGITSSNNTEVIIPFSGLLLLAWGVQSGKTKEPKKK